MSYSTIATCVGDQAFLNRVNACIAQEQAARNETVNPGFLLTQMSWAVASAADVEAAYASALEAQHGNPGGDEAVISDGMILGNVQASWPPPPGPVVGPTAP
jgi:hypothetical protein